MPRIDKKLKLCIGCGKLAPMLVQCLDCGSTLLAPGGASNETAKNATRPRAHSLADVDEWEFHEVSAQLLACCEARVPLTSSIIVTGPAGVGKSTEVAALVLEWVRAGRKSLVLDAEMGKALAKNTFVRAGAKGADLAKIKRVCPGVDGIETFGDACEIVETNRPELVVVDSIDEWERYAEGGREEVTQTIGRLGQWAQERIVISIAHYAREGHVFGSVKADHRADTVLTVEGEEIWQKKCTWAPPGKCRRRRPS